MIRFMTKQLPYTVSTASYGFTRLVWLSVSRGQYIILSGWHTNHYVALWGLVYFMKYEAAGTSFHAGGKTMRQDG